MKVFKKQTVRFILGGKQVKAGTKKAKRQREHSKRFYGTLRLANGKSKQVSLCEDEATAKTLLMRLQGEEDSKRANGADRYFDERQRPLAEFLIEFISYLQSKGNSPRYIQQAEQRISKILIATKAKTIHDIDGGRILKTLHDWRQRKENSLSITTSNDYLIAIKSFSRWLWQERKSPDDALAGLRRMNAETDRRRVRRALSPAELETLTRITQQNNKTFRGEDWQLTATDRVFLYLIASYTGLRASECASLTKSSFDFESKTFTLEAIFAKNRKRTTLPLHTSLSTKLKAWFATLKREALFPGSWAFHNKAGEILKRDLRKANIETKDASGRVLDFHSLRYTFITSLAKAGVHPSKAQRLARHSTITLTMDVYTSLNISDLREAVSSIPFAGTNCSIRKQ